MIYRYVLPDYFYSGGVDCELRIRVQLDNNRLLLIDSIQKVWLRVRLKLGVTIWRPETSEDVTASK